MGARVAREPARDGLTTLPLSAAYALDRAKHLEHWTFAGFVAIRPASVAFTGTSGTFVRDASIETSDDGTAWERIGYGRVARFADGSGEGSFAFPERTASFVRVTVDDGNDAPLAGAIPHLAAVPHDIVFEANAGHTYRLLSKNPAALAPTYDLAARLAHEAWTASAATTESTRAFASYVGPVDRRTLTQKYPWLLSIAIGVLAIVLTLFALTTLRKANVGDAPETID